MGTQPRTWVVSLSGALRAPRVRLSSSVMSEHLRPFYSHSHQPKGSLHRPDTNEQHLFLGLPKLEIPEPLTYIHTGRGLPVASQQGEDVVLAIVAGTGNQGQVRRVRPTISVPRSLHSWNKHHRESRSQPMPSIKWHEEEAASLGPIQTEHSHASKDSLKL